MHCIEPKPAAKQSILPSPAWRDFLSVGALDTMAPTYMTSMPAGAVKIFLTLFLAWGGGTKAIPLCFFVQFLVAWRYPAHAW